MQLDKIALGKKAKELGFVRDTLEKVYRLADILTFFEQDELLSCSLALKGGTAINLTIFDLPRLSVDIDLDYCKNIAREDMLADRDIIKNKIEKYMTANGYALSAKSKFYHALYSYVYEYTNHGGSKDNIKIEINYMLRCHVIAPSRKEVHLPWDDSDSTFTVLTLDKTEILAAKTVALLSRAAARDLYDMHNVAKNDLFSQINTDLYRKCVVFYSAIGAEHPPRDFSFESFAHISQMQIKKDLDPVLRKGERFDLKAAKSKVRNFLLPVLVPTDAEKEFWNSFRNKKYLPDLIFGDSIEYKNVENHPMALWKCRTQD
jgi:predicted nucleotidyltransferase component of viral defense system